MPHNSQALWLNLKEGLQNYEDASTESTNTPPSEATRVDEDSRELAFVTTERVRRRSVDGVSLHMDKERIHSRSRTVPYRDDKDVMLLFSQFEFDQLKAKSLNLCQSQETVNAGSDNVADRISEETETRESHFEAPDLIPFLEEAERISKFAIGAYGTNMMKILGYVSKLKM